jgi:serine/threonine-protein kinase
MNEQALPRLPVAGYVIDGRYELLSPMARGGMATVWQARDRKLARDVAVKILHTRQLEDALQAARIQVEAQALAQLSHSNITVIHDAGTINGDVPAPYLVMELVRGKPLSVVARRLPWPMAASIVAQVADALAVVHARGLVHRDVSAANVLLTTGGVKLVDFGICAMIGDSDCVDDGRIMGTVAYIAPERLRGMTVHPAVDIYALGALFHLLVTGEHPWPRSGDPAEDLNAVLHRQPPRLGSELPASIRDLCSRCLHTDPLRRPTAGEVASVLRKAGARWDPETASTLLDQREALATTVVFTGPSNVRTLRAKSQRRQGNRGRSIAALAAFSIIGLAVWPLSRWSPSSEVPQTVALPIAAKTVISLACHATYQTLQTGGGRFQAKITILNLGTQSVPAGWRLQLSFPSRVVASAGAAWDAAENSIATKASSDALASREPQALDLIGQYTAQIPRPSDFRLNGTPCTGTVIDPAPVKNNLIATTIISYRPPDGKPAKGNGNQTGHKPSKIKSPGTPAGPR